MNSKPYFDVGEVPSTESLDMAIEKETRSKKPDQYLIRRYESWRNYSGFWYFQAGHLISVGVTFFSIKYDSRDKEEYFSSRDSAIKAAKKKLKEIDRKPSIGS